MKKLLLFVLVALVMVALVACGETTTATTTTTTPTTGGNPTTESSTAPGSSTEDPVVGGDYEPLYNEGIDIMYGSDPDWWAINAIAYNGYGVMFEDHHASLNYEWAMLIEIIESMEPVYDYLFPVITTTDAEGNEVSERQPNPLYDFIVTIDGKDIPITLWSNAYGETSASYIRMALGDWEPVDGPHNYKISMRVVEKASGSILFWANWADENTGKGGYQWDRPTKLGYVEDVNFAQPDDVEMVAQSGKNYFEGVSGPNGSSAENYEKLFDGDVNTKLCDGSEYKVVFKARAELSYNPIQGIAIVGANDDASYNDRIIKSFKLYGSNEGSDSAADYWTLITEETYEPTGTDNFSYRYFGIEDNNAKYDYYMIEFVHEGTYQVGEILIYVGKDEWSVVE